MLKAIRHIALILLAVLPICQAAVPEAHAAQPYMLYLPLTARSYKPGYVTPFGVTMYWGINDRNGLPQMAAAHSGRVTTFLFWYLIEPTAPVGGVHNYRWSGFDASVANAQAHGMDVFVLLSGNPAWAAATSVGPVTNTKDLTDFVSAAVGRYAGEIRDWSFYAEPDMATRWGNDPAGYADMLASVAKAVHAANPNARVMNGGLAYDGFTWGFVESFLPGVLAALSQKPGGIRATLDAVAFHFYPINTRWPTIADKARVIRGILTQYEVGDLPLRVPEMGFWSTGSSSQITQARELVKIYARGLAAGIEQLSWFSVYDDGCNCGLFPSLYAEGNLDHPKLAYTAYANLVNELYGATYLYPLAIAGVEGYVFDNLSGLPQTVLWASVPAGALVPFAATCLRSVDALGVTTVVRDGQAQDNDGLAGQVTLRIASDQPLYVTPCTP